MLDAATSPSAYPQDEVAALLDESAEAGRREAIKEGIQDFLGRDDPEMVKKIIGTRQPGGLPTDSAFERMLAGVSVHLDERKSRWIDEPGGHWEGHMGYTHDFEPELERQRIAKDAGLFGQAIWGGWGNGQGRHVMHMSHAALNLFILRYGFHPADDLMETQRISVNDPWVREFFTNPM